MQKIKMMVMLKCKMVSTLLRNRYCIVEGSLTFSVGEQLVLTGRQNVFTETSLQKSFSSRWSKQVGKIILTASAWPIMKPLTLQRSLLVTPHLKIQQQSQTFLY